MTIGGLYIFKVQSADKIWLKDIPRSNMTK